MTVKLNKQGIGLPTVLGIVAFVLAIVATLLTYAVAQAQLVDKNIDRTEAYANAVQSVDATLKIIVRDQNLDPTYLTALETYMGVSIEAYSATVYTITSMVTSTKSVTSYITGTASSNSTYEALLQYTGTEPGFVLSPLITPTTLLASYLPLFIETTFPSLTPETEFTSFQSIVDYIYSLTLTSGSYVYQLPTVLTNQTNPTVTGHWYINGSVILPKNKSLTIPDNYLLFINGNLTLDENSVLIGKVVINGNLLFKGKTTTLEQPKGTFYVNGDITTSRNSALGTVSRPTFMFAEGDISLANSISGYGYFLSQNFNGSLGGVVITGGVYASVLAKISPAGIAANPDLDEDNFYVYGVPTLITTEGGGGSGTISFKYTFPKLN
ncbi:MAG: hypothetical protein KKG64_03850 [Firmicutes bacterium]|nr:hypothetical protein [Bacillota bacterium]